MKQILLILIFLVACMPVQINNTIDNTEVVEDDENVMEVFENDTEEVMDEIKWTDIILKDVNTGDEFKISELKKPVLIESFAVWCPTCKKQQDEFKELHDFSDIISVSVNTDPNENEEKILEHVNRYDYDWKYAVAPVEFTRLLIDEFGTAVVNAPSAPVILLCENSSKLLQRGVKTAEELMEAAKCS